MRGHGGAPGWRAGARARYAGPGKARGRLYDLGAYPGAVFDRNATGYVGGELYLLGKPEALADLDRYEGRRFVRRQVEVLLENGRSVSAWAYALNRSAPAARRIPSGDYRRH